jgi:DNA replicative helicase MCM subunit Mcm2 (Cdc46/Mcm family)
MPTHGGKIMSDVKSFRYNGLDEEWKKFKRIVEDSGSTIEEKISSFVSQEVTLADGKKEEDSATASNYEKQLKDKLLQTDLSQVIINGSYHVEIDDIDFIMASGHELSERITNAVHGALYHYWLRRWAKTLNIDERQIDVKYSTDERQRQLVKFNQTVKRVKVTFSCNIPIITLSDLRESDLGNVIQFDCIIIGPTPKKLDTMTGKYIQSVLIQEPESSSKNNNPVMIKAILHGDDTNNIASGQTKRFIGTYRTQEPVNGQKVESEKTLIIDAIAVFDIEEKAEIELSPHELQIAKEFAEKEESEYIKKLINSFCPKIYGRELEKKALYLSLLGGSEFVGYRKESHIMLVGEADTGKSELVKFANQIANKSSIVDGSNATGVGILFALDEYDGMKILRQGAMILNSGGHLIVDEYDKMPKSEQKKLNQAMEQQRATYNKGGHMGNAECKTAVIASCNPENERWNEEKSLIDNLPFDASTISRYDIVIRLKHETHENQIRAKMSHIARQKRGETIQVADPRWLKGLLNHLRKLRPTFTPEAEELLINKFVEFTQIEQESGSLPIQTRQMEGIQRLCEAWAKMLFKTKIDTKIINDVIKFYQECLATLGMNVEKGITQMDLRGHSVNKDEYFEDIFSKMSKDNDDGHVFIHDLAEELKQNHNMFASDESVSRYVEARKKSGWLFEPKLGVLKRQ